MKNSTKLIAIALVAVAAIFGAVQPAAAQVTGTTAVSIDLSPLVILYYYSDLTVNLTSADLTTALGVTAQQDRGATSVAPTGVAGSLTGTLDPTLGNTPGAPALLAALPLTINNAWAVRALAATLSVTIAIGDPTLNDGASQISLGGASVNPAAPVAAGLGTPIRGAVTLNLDLSQATTTNLHTGGAYTITVTAV